MNDECREADEYVRDHMLIEWMIDYVYSHMDERPEPVEVIYEKWTEWLQMLDQLKEMEVKNDKGSTV